MVLSEVREVLTRGVHVAITLSAIASHCATAQASEVWMSWVQHPKPHELVVQSKESLSAQQVPSQASEILTVLAEHNPVEVVDFTSNQELTSFLESKEPFLVSVLLAYYTAFVELSNVEALRVFSGISSFKTSHMATGLLIRRLFSSGWFHQDDIHFIAKVFQGSGNNNIREALLELYTNALNEDYFSERVAGEFSDDVSPSVANLDDDERLFLMVVFLMTRVSGAFSRKRVAATGRDQLPAVYANTEFSPGVLAFVFGAVFAASEQGYPIVTRLLQQSVVKLFDIEEAMRFF